MARSVARNLLRAHSLLRSYPVRPNRELWLGSGNAGTNIKLRLNWRVKKSNLVYRMAKKNIFMILNLFLFFPLLSFPLGTKFILYFFARRLGHISRRFVYFAFCRWSRITLARFDHNSRSAETLLALLVFRFIQIYHSRAAAPRKARGSDTAKALKLTLTHYRCIFGASLYFPFSIFGHLFISQ